jgi:hypothetical protein
MNDLEAFIQLAQALAPWRGKLVFVGGWAHRLHRLHPRATPQAHQPVFTRDTDLAFSAAEPIEGDMKAALEGHGFKEQFSGELKPPVTHYSLGQQDKGFYAEFLTPLAGSGFKRGGQPDATLSKAGVIAQKIRHLDILLVDPWVVNLNPQNAPLKAPLDVQVANPLAFMVQKFLIQSHRPAKKRAQDILYIFDTVGLFATQLEAFQTMWEAIIGPALGKSRDEVLKLNEQTFSKLTDDVRNAALIPQDRKISAEEIRSTCQFAFEQVFRL